MPLDPKEEIKSKIDIVSVISSYGCQLKQNGSGLWCCCPFHNEKTPSFKVDSAKGTYHCFGCGESGDVFSFVMKQEGLSFSETIKKLGESVGVDIKEYKGEKSNKRKTLYSLMSALAMDFNKLLKSPKCKDADIARDYLKQRGIDDETRDRFLIGYAPKESAKILSWASRHGYTVQDLEDAGIIKVGTGTKQPYFYFANRLVFTIKDKAGHVVAFSGRQLVEDKKSGKYINSPETDIFKKSRNYFAFDEARKYIVKAPNREAIICEGQIDCIRLHTNGFNTAIAPLGTAFTEDHAVMLHRVADSAILCFDDDGAGHKATIKAAHLLLSEGMPIRVISLPDGDDPDSFIFKHGAKAFQNLISHHSESIVQYQTRVMREAEKDSTDTNKEVRVSKAVIETISKCSDKVYRNILSKEAAKVLGIEYKTISEEILSVGKKEEAEKKEDSEKLISPQPQTNESKEEKVPISIVEGAFIKFLIQRQNRQDVQNCVSKLVPIDILHSSTAKRLVSAILGSPSADDTKVREIVENLSTAEYEQFITTMADIDTSEFVGVPDKDIIMYYTRLLWHQYLSRELTASQKEGKDVSLYKNGLTCLYSETMRGVVKFIQTFPFRSA